MTSKKELRDAILELEAKHKKLAQSTYQLILALQIFSDPELDGLLFTVERAKELLKEVKTLRFEVAPLGN